MNLWTALAIGFFGSFHCIGMCGPIALALSKQPRESGFHFISGRLIYNFGRVITYSLLGAIFGGLGHVISLAGLQGPVSIVLGAIIILAVLLPKQWTHFMTQTAGFRSIFEYLKQWIARLFRHYSYSSLLSIGILNGFLPCGFVYMGLAGAITTGTILSSTAYMALFGVGTIPAMLGVSLASGAITMDMRRKINKLVPYLAFALGVLFVLRGLGLGIPFISPNI